MRRKLLLLLCSTASALILIPLSSSPASAYGGVPSGNVGTDISWPQCGTDYPSGYTFAILGVTGGRPFTGNGCFFDEFWWAKKWSLPTELYINLDFGQSASGPLSCLDGDQGCQAYNYGWLAAGDAWNYARFQTGGATTYVPTWWLDIETENDWSNDTSLNSYVIQGALDYLERIQGRTVGVYSTAYQWGAIAGSYAPAGTPNWVAGADDLYDWDFCSAAIFPGGVVWRYQYLNLDIDLDQDRACY